MILETADAEAAKAAVEAIKDVKPVVNGVNKDNLEAMNEIAKTYGIVLGVQGADLTSCTTPSKHSRRPATRIC